MADKSEKRLELNNAVLMKRLQTTQSTNAQKKILSYQKVRKARNNTTAIRTEHKREI